MTEEDWSEAEKADADPEYIDELQRLAYLKHQGILTDEE